MIMEGVQDQLQLPVGFRFHPTDVELLDYYLRRRIAGLPTPQCLIQECDVYKVEPWQLPGDSFRYRKEENEMYFFTPRYPSSKGSRKVNRSAGKGFWDGRARDVPITKNVMDNQIAGHRVQFVFKLRHGEEKIRTDWIMHEYRLPSNKFDDLVLCRIHKKKRKCQVGVGEEEEEEEDEEERRPVKRQHVVEYDDNAVLLPPPSSSSSQMPQLSSMEGGRLKEEPTTLDADSQLQPTAAAAAADCSYSNADGASTSLLEEYINLGVDLAALPSWDELFSDH